ncbi:MAG: baseplate J/gp47 family protein [Deltaproteobacteria bacterium]|nr:baseplate J/gp47 family protein [Deltaproteobacteria bacterium]
MPTIEKDIDTIRTEMFNRIDEVQEEYIQKGYMTSWLNLRKGVFRGLIEIWCWALNQVYLIFKAMLDQCFIETASGVWLELLCRIVGVEKKDATKAKGNIQFVRVEGSTGNIVIKAGRIVKTKPDGKGEVYRYVTTEDIVLSDGEIEVAVPVEAESYGSGSNAVTGQICELSTSVSQIDSVYNKSNWLTSEGADVESDDSLKNRYMLAWTGKDGCTAEAYESWGLGVEGVLSVTVADQHPRGQGTVDVLVMGAAGIPTAELISAVDEVIQYNKPINDDVLVKGPTGVPIDIDVELVLSSGTSAEIITEAENRINALFATTEIIAGIPHMKIGEDVVLDRLTAVLMGITGIKKINYTSPSSDTTIVHDGLAVLNNVNITTVAASEV